MRDPVGSQIIDDIYSTMEISEEWSTRQERGFTWWGHTLAQRVWADPPRQNNGQLITRIHIETDLLREVPDTPQVLKHLALINRWATLSALVLDTRTKQVRSQSTIYASRDGLPASELLALNAATLQVGEAFIRAETLTGGDWSPFSQSTCWQGTVGSAISDPWEQDARSPDAAAVGSVGLPEAGTDPPVIGYAGGEGEPSGLTSGCTRQRAIMSGPRVSRKPFDGRPMTHGLRNRR